MRGILIALVQIYRYAVSPALRAICGPGCGCRYEPSCSAYALAALRGHGALRGSALALGRIARCHPWGGCGYDPVPASPRLDAGSHRSGRAI